jgi:ferredoxin
MEAYATANSPMPCRSVTIDVELCTGCNSCVDVCRSDVMVYGAQERDPPVVLFPDECWFCGCCVDRCAKGAIRMNHPLNQRVGWKRKETGEFFRVGMKNPPAPNNRPPVGGW